MTVTVVAIFDEFNPHAPLAKVLKERLIRLASDLQNVHLKSLASMPPMDDDIVIYISYNLKYNVRWRIANDVPDFVEKEVAQICALQGYIAWKTSTVNVFKGNK
ncbi:hypothetical protein EZ428_07650 [Pedobacter frigiditerrae]|uniref:Uncharacterized protein n=1 Tax=Pedobacter frigiditerrae TaxID=2530452 RepID=A0A4R0MWJ6_9SPHI|nr:hypothetical protein [Pedobacter frigiditerrae]TCC91629.1 hypothetical protein EZ428_07650 [Pedobacter frigiditerrae]